MKIYFVRHGQSILNAQPKFQFPNTPLSDLGKKQSEKVFGRLAKLQIDLIITSTYLRALQTTEIINQKLGKPIMESPLFVERKMPTSFLGKSVSDPEILPFHQKLRENYFNLDWHLEDEENFYDLKLRANMALDFIFSQQKENILVVSHGDFLTILIFHLIFAEVNENSFFKKFKNHTELSNAGLTIFEYNDNKWKLLCMNDTSNLA